MTVAAARSEARTAEAVDRLLAAGADEDLAVGVFRARQPAIRNLNTDLYASPSASTAAELVLDARRRLRLS
jgi:hypothetical protein